MVERSQPDINVRRFWFGIAAPTVAWASHLVIAYGFQSVACQWGFLQFNLLGIPAITMVLLVLTLLAGVVVVSGGLILYRIHRDLSSRETAPQEDPSGRVRFMARAGSWLSGLYLFALVMIIFPILFLEQCSAYWW
jgi:hypothetical protein